MTLTTRADCIFLLLILLRPTFKETRKIQSVMSVVFYTREQTQTFLPFL